MTAKQDFFRKYLNREFNPLMPIPPVSPNLLNDSIEAEIEAQHAYNALDCEKCDRGETCDFRNKPERKPGFLPGGHGMCARYAEQFGDAVVVTDEATGKTDILTNDVIVSILEEVQTSLAPIIIEGLTDEQRLQLVTFLHSVAIMPADKLNKFIKEVGGNV